MTQLPNEIWGLYDEKKDRWFRSTATCLGTLFWNKADAEQYIVFVDLSPDIWKPRLVGGQRLIDEAMLAAKPSDWPQQKESP